MPKARSVLARKKNTGNVLAPRAFAMLIGSNDWDLSTAPPLDVDKMAENRHDERLGCDLSVALFQLHRNL